MPPRVLRRLHGEYLVGQRHELVALPPVADADQVDVRVDQPRQHRPVRVVKLLDRRALRRHDAITRPRGYDGAVPNEHGPPLDGRRSRTVDEPLRCDEGVSVSGVVGHYWASLPVPGGLGGVVLAVAGAFVACLVGRIVDELAAVADVAVLDGLRDERRDILANPVHPHGVLPLEEVDADGVFLQSDPAASDHRRLLR